MAKDSTVALVAKLQKGLQPRLPVRKAALVAIGAILLLAILTLGRWSTATTVLLISSAFAMGILFRSSYARLPLEGLIKCNGDLEERVSNNLIFFGLAEKQITIVTGSLFEGVYDHAGMVTLFDGLPAHVNIHLIVTSPEQTISSKEFYAVLLSRGAHIEFLPGSKLRHGAIVDDKHVKLEERNVPDLKKDKEITYYMFHRKMALQGLAEIQKNLVSARQERRLLEQPA